MSDDEREKPQARVQTIEDRPGFKSVKIEAPFTHDDGWCKVTVGWHEDEMSGENGKRVGAWVAQCGEPTTHLGHSRTSQLEAMADLVRSATALNDILIRREAELHKVIYNSTNTLVKELSAARTDLGLVQQTICNTIDGPTTGELEPLWRAQRALEAVAAWLTRDRQEAA